MKSYTIDVQPTKEKDFLRIIRSLQNSGMVSAFHLAGTEFGNKKRTKPDKHSEQKQNQENKFTRYLLDWPEMSDDELNYIEEKRKHINKWR